VFDKKEKIRLIINNIKIDFELRSSSFEKLTKIDSNENIVINPSIKTKKEIIKYINLENQSKFSFEIVSLKTSNLE
jgi:hypothetical protein